MRPIYRSIVKDLNDCIRNAKVMGRRLLYVELMDFEWEEFRRELSSEAIQAVIDGQDGSDPSVLGKYKGVWLTLAKPPADTPIA